ncbi:type II toxin-antitoxin system RelE/ParE family toxin [Macrococcoides goetzii]|nr:type II toxin-antitoxin system RelE/ParE family toxin [Macrococcus goetzii]TDM39281.1 type II toxin-antitoxin system RelE/ParE family toxin [Macrococcus goetzii]TDM47342.1 type II toxin-antitoxin system RelE/ParE family toxin [Macrococcus goetzii]
MEKERYKVTYLSTFYNDLSDIIEYFQNDLKNNLAAEKFLDNVENAVLKRSKTPLILPPVYKNTMLNLRFYRIIVSNYSIYYVVNNDKVEFRRIIHNKRDINTSQL